MKQKTNVLNFNFNISFISIFVTVVLLVLAASPVCFAEQQFKDTRTVVDGYGTTVSIPDEVNKVVVLQGACNVPAVMSALGVGDKIIKGVCQKNPMLIKVQPGYENIETVQVPNGNANIEDLLKLSPDVVIGWDTLKNAEAIRDAGIPLVIENLSSYESTAEAIGMVADVTGSQEKGDELLQYFNDIEKMIDDKVSSVPMDQRKQVLILRASDPINIMGSDSYVCDTIEKAGSISVTQNMPGYFISTDIEQLLTLDPDIIIVSSTSPSSYDDVMKNSTWDSLRAKKEGQVYLSPTGVYYWDKSGPEMPLFMLWAMNLFHPELLSDDQLKEETKKFYTTFFNYDLSDEDYNMILNSNR